MLLVSTCHFQHGMQTIHHHIIGYTSCIERGLLQSKVGRSTGGAFSQKACVPSGMWQMQNVPTQEPRNLR